jgi:two-component system LytT family response regulator
MILKAILIDDEKNNLINLRNMLQPLEDLIEIVGEARQVDEAYSLIQLLQPQVLFLDIQMPNKNGFDLLVSLPKSQLQQMEVIFVTAYDEYGIQAIKFSALDYLLKPIKQEDLNQAVRKAFQRISEKNKNQQLELLVAQLSKNSEITPSKISLNTLKENYLVDLKDIIRLESANNYTTFVLVKDKNILVSKPIFEYDKMLQNLGFIRCHQSHMVNMHHIQALVNEDGGYLRMSNQEKIPISRLKKGEVKSKIGML